MADINVGQIAEALNEKMDRNLANTDAIGQAILDGKVEVEALLEQNGYAKFTWKNGNKISKLIIQWGNNVFSDVGTAITLPSAFATTNYTVTTAPVQASQDSVAWCIGIVEQEYKRTKTAFTAYGWNKDGHMLVKSMWLTIGN